MSLLEDSQMSKCRNQSAKFVQELSKLLHKIVSQLQIFHKVNNWSSLPSRVWLVKVGKLSWWIGVVKVGKFEGLGWLMLEILAKNKKKYMWLTLGNFNRKSVRLVWLTLGIIAENR